MEKYKRYFEDEELLDEGIVDSVKKVVNKGYNKVDHIINKKKYDNPTSFDKDAPKKYHAKIKPLRDRATQIGSQYNKLVHKKDKSDSEKSKQASLRKQIDDLDKKNTSYRESI